jgi:hypothetical protein
MLRQKDAIISRLEAELQRHVYLVAHASSQGYRAPDVGQAVPAEPKPEIVFAPKEKRVVVVPPGLSAGETAYRLKSEGYTWGEIASAMGRGTDRASRSVAMNNASGWARRTGNPWPIPA